jgi:hypothetical protein
VVWDVATGRQILALRRGASLVAFSPRAAILATAGGSEHRVSLWNLAIDTWAERACERANRNLTCAEWRRYLGEVPYHAVCPQLPAPTDCDTDTASPEPLR